eukprot:2385786-Prymnesium_polylepis.1
MPKALGWDCYEGERVDLIDEEFRSPCLCKAPSPDDWLGWFGTIGEGLELGLVLSVLLVGVGVGLD